MDIKVFNKTIFDDLHLFLKGRKVWKQLEMTDSEIIDTLSSYLNSQNKKLYVLFQNNKIKATLGVFEWMRLPYYTIIDYYCDYEGKLSNYKIYNEKLWTHVISSMEDVGRHSFYWCIKSYPLANLKKREEPQLVKIIPILKKYQFNIEAIVESNDSSKFEIYNSFVTKKFNGVYQIKRATLKSKYFNYGKN